MNLIATSLIRGSLSRIVSLPRCLMIAHDVVQSLGSCESAPGLDFRHLRTGYDVPRRQFHHFFGVSFHETFVLVVNQVTPFSPGGLGDEDTRRHQAGRVELDKLHVFQGQSGPVGKGHAVTGNRVGIGGKAVDPASAAGGKDNGFGTKGHEGARRQVDGGNPAVLAILDQQGGDHAFVIAGNLRVFLQIVIEGMDLQHPGFIGCEDRPGEAVPPEGTLVNPAV